jgi:hypothetical protein
MFLKAKNGIDLKIFLAVDSLTPGDPEAFETGVATRTPESHFK